MEHSIWPLADLEVRTPRMVLRYIDDDRAARLAKLAAGGIHDPAMTPFRFPWTDVAPPQLERNTMQYFWRCRANAEPNSWIIDFAAEVDGKVAGTVGLNAQSFPSLRQVTTGSWLGRAFQGHGLGKEMRIAALTLAFDGIDADLALTDAWHDNGPSLGVTNSLGYSEVGRRRALRRDSPDLLLEFEMSREHFDTIRRDDITLHGVEAVRDLLQTGR